MNTNTFTKEDIERGKTMAGLGYIIFFLPLIVMKESKFAKFHANQILLLLIPSVIINIICGLLYVYALGSLRLGLASFISIIMLVIDLLIGIIAIINMIAAFQGKAKRIPLLGKITLINGSNDFDAEDMIQNEKLNNMADNLQNFSFAGGIISCPQCGNKVSKGKNFCPKCGANIPKDEPKPKQKKQTCSGCGTAIPTGTKFCPECGMVIPKEEPKDTTIKCLNCGTTIADGIKFCPECGTPAPKPEPAKPIEYKCIQCGITVPEGTKFCPECGHKM